MWPANFDSGAYVRCGRIFSRVSQAVKPTTWHASFEFKPYVVANRAIQTEFKGSFDLYTPVGH